MREGLSIRFGRAAGAAAVIAVIAVLESGCSRSTEPSDDGSPDTITLAQLSVPILAASDERLFTLSSIDSTTRALTSRSLGGDERWTTMVEPCPTGLRCAIALDAAGNVYINTVAGLMSRSGSDGKLRWLISSIQTPAIAVGSAARIYATGRPFESNQLIYSIDANLGTVMWSSILPPGLDATSVLLDETRLNLYAIGRGGVTTLDAQTGAIKWIASQNCLGGGDGALSSEGAIYVTCDVAGSSRILSYNQSGTLMWQVTLGTSQGSLAPVIDSNGIVYAGNASSVTALNKDGTIAWKLTGLFRNQTNPIVDAAQNVYVSASRISSISGRYLFVVRNGEIAEYKGLYPCVGSLMLTESGRLYCAELGIVVHIPTAGNDGLTQWSQAGHDAGRTGRR